MRCALRFLLLGLGLLLSLVTSLVFPSAVLASLRINEILPAPQSDWDGDLLIDSKKDEWVEISNDGPASVDLTGYLLLNGDGRTPVYGFSGSLAAGGHLLVRGDDALAWEAANGEAAIGLSLNNSGDIVWLAALAGSDTSVVDSLEFAASSVGYDVSLGRMPDGNGAWAIFDHFAPMGGNGQDPTPGQSNSSDPGPHVLGITRSPLYPTQDDSVKITVEGGSVMGVSRALLFYQVNLENGEEPEMLQVSGTSQLGTWAYTLPPCAADDTVRYRISLSDNSVTTVTTWMGYKVRSGGLAVRLNEVLADPPSDATGDANRDGVRDSADDEFIELVNCGPTPVDIAGWKLADATSVRHVFPDTGMVLAPGEFLTVFGGGSPTGFAGKVMTASSGSLHLTNTSDVVSLLDRSGALVDILSYSNEGNKDQAMIRYPDCSGGWVLPSQVGLQAPFTPQAPNGGGSPVSPTTWGGIKALFR
ncbi:MAG TPA: lamin tail domain-containing protein [bacterium]|nr:lamin tail domain-containing protein [bacterium]